MIDHLFINVSNLTKSTNFYRKALAPIGYSATPRFTLPSKAKGVGFGPEGERDFHIIQGPKVVTPNHVAFRVPHRKQVDAFYKAALAAGGKDNGSPGLTPEHGPTYYSAYVLDLDGHNIEVVSWAKK